jgi:hypothetical protein
MEDELDSDSEAGEEETSEDKHSSDEDYDEEHGQSRSQRRTKSAMVEEGDRDSSRCAPPRTTSTQQEVSMVQLSSDKSC